MRRPALLLVSLAVLAALVVGIVQAGGEGTEEQPVFNLGAAKRQLAGAPPPLAKLHRQANQIEPDGDVKRYEEIVRELRGYPVVVNVWASWCGPCKLEFPIFQQVSTRLGKRVAFLGVDLADNRPRAEEFLASNPVPYPSLEDADTRIAQHVGMIAGPPLTVFYDRRGRKFVHQGGYTKTADLVRDIERYAGA